MGFWKDVQIDIDNGLSKNESIRINSLLKSNDIAVKKQAEKEYEEIIKTVKFNQQIDYLE